MTRKRSNSVSVVLVNFRGSDDTIDCIKHLQALNWPSAQLEIIVVENASGDDSLRRLKELGSEITLVESKQNLGFAGGCNLGVTKATGEFVAFLNNDARPDPNWVAAAVETFDQSADIGAVASKVLDWDGVDVDYVDAAVNWFGMGYKPHAGERDRGSWNTEKDVLFGTGAAMFIRTELYERLNGFDESYFMFYEDVDLGWRLNLLGYRFRFQPRSLAYHKHHASMEKFGNYHETYLLERNALYTLYKNVGEENLAAYLPGALLLAVRRATGRGQIDSKSLDLRNAGDDRARESAVSKQMLAGFYAVDQLVEHLPELSVERARIQSTRVRSDRQLRILFGNLDEPAYPIESYLDGYENIISALDIVEEKSRRRILVVTGDPVGERMAGPAIRAWNIARVLSEEHDVRLVSMTKAVHRDEPFEVSVASYHHQATMAPHEKWADVIVVQGHALELFPVLSNSTKAIVVDVYDPLHLEQLEQGRTKGLDEWTKQVGDATEALNHQLSLGDFFLCASDRQRHFWLGQLAGIGRVNPLNYARDNDLDSLIAIAPFGIPDVAPKRSRAAIKGVVSGITERDKVIIWAGGIYNWFDPETLIEAVGALATRHGDVRLFFMGTQHPNPLVPEMETLVRARRLSDSLGLTGRVVFFNESWVDYDDRQNYLLDADVGVSTHFQHVETTYSFRTRILDYLWAGLPIVTTDGDSFAELVAAESLGAVVAERDREGLETQLEALLYDAVAQASARERVKAVRGRFEWSRVMAPLIDFCNNPLRAADRVPGVVQSLSESRSGRALVNTRTRHTGFRRDFDRAVYYFREGGTRAVLERLTARRRRLKETR